ncbi:hypothetical protein AGMMS49950_08880 [Endomicrobiia bacterium]|nr:hypothetical protein AGMMS49950_08880 [Endomicrobiia bacterium]
MEGGGKWNLRCGLDKSTFIFFAGEHQHIEDVIKVRVSSFDPNDIKREHMVYRYALELRKSDKRDGDGRDVWEKGM